MKRTSQLIVLAGLAAIAFSLFTFSGCKKDGQDPVPPKTDSITGNVALPDWKVAEGYDMTSSMTVVAKVDLSLTYTADQLKDAFYQLSDSDLLAAFAGDECVGVGKPESNGLFYFGIAAPKTQGTPIVLRYYSKKVSNIFEAQSTLTFQNDERIGDHQNPYTPEFKVKK